MTVRQLQPLCSRIHMMFDRYCLSVFLFLLFVCRPPFFAQQELRTTLQQSLDRQKGLETEMWAELAKATNDTLKADIYFRYFDLIEGDLSIHYGPPLVRHLDSALVAFSGNQLMYRSLLDRKATALRFLWAHYNSKEGAGSVTGSKLLDEAIGIYKQTGNDALLTDAYIEKADDFLRQGKLFRQFQVLKEGMELEEHRGYLRGLARFYIQMQLFYANVGDTVQVMDYIDKSVALEKKIADRSREARGFYLAALTYSRLQLHTKAIASLRRSLAAYQRDTAQLRDRYWQTYNLLAEEYLKSGALDSALLAYERMIVETTTSGDLKPLFLATLGKGRARSLMGDHEEAIRIHSDVLALVKQGGALYDSPGRMCYAELARDHYEAGHYVLAQHYIEQALQVAQMERLATAGLYDLEEIAHRIDSTAGNTAGAYLHYRKLNALRSELDKQSVARLAARDQFMSEMSAFRQEQDQQKAKDLAERSRQRTILLGVLAVLVFTLLLAATVFLSLRRSRRDNRTISQQKAVVEEQKRVVEEKQKEILDSIAYAKRLQQALIPPKSFIDLHAPHNFVFYQPKDIVAGDFYWADKVDDLLFIAAGDSTGHGVPGAMVSVVCSTALGRAVNEFGERETGRILDKARELVIETFAKSADEVKDGMDVSLLCIDATRKTVSWSGANNPLWYVSGGEMAEIKPDKQPVGRSELQTAFTTHRLAFTPGTVFYLFTDGFADQFGGPAGKKFKYRPLKDLLHRIAPLDLAEQGKILEKELMAWKGHLEQVDDICVIGIRI